MQQPVPTVTPDQIDAAIAEVEYTEVGDACTTMATVTLDNGFVVTGAHYFSRAKYFVASEGRALALADARIKVLGLLQFRAMDHAMNGAQLAEATALPATPYPVEAFVPISQFNPDAAPVDDQPLVFGSLTGEPVPPFDPDVTPTDAEPSADPAE